MNHFSGTNRIRLLSAITAILLATPFSLNQLSGFYLWMSPFIMLNSVLYLKTWVWFNFISLLVLVTVLIRKRWFCRYLCPVGMACDLASEFSKKQKNYLNKIPQIGEWLAAISLVGALSGFPLLMVLDPLAIFNGFFTIFSLEINLLTLVSLSGLPVLIAVHLFLPGLWCGKICPLGGFQDIAFYLKSKAMVLFRKEKETRKAIDRGRRLFLASGTGAAAGLIIPHFLRNNHQTGIRPPASLPEPRFNTLCIRCGSCMKACPTRIIVPDLAPDNLMAWMTPVIRFRKSYCIETCNLCSTVCPSGSITLFSIEAKKEIVMGIAEIHPENCLLTRNAECDRCKQACKYHAVSIEKSEQSILMKPVVDEKKCVGCGACVVICPPEVIRVIPVNS